MWVQALINLFQESRAGSSDRLKPQRSVDPLRLSDTAFNEHGKNRDRIIHSSGFKIQRRANIDNGCTCTLNIVKLGSLLCRRFVTMLIHGPRVSVALQ